MNDTGLYINELLDSFSEVTVLNNGIATHVRGGVLDLTILSTSLLPIADWKLHPYLTSDHLATITTVRIPRVTLPPPIPRWNLKKANWPLFTDAMEKWASNYIPPSDATQLEKDFTNAIHNANKSSIPLTNVTLHAHKNCWFYNDRIRELKHRMNMFRKALHRSHSPTILESFRTLRRLVKMEISEIKAKAWLSWCETITAHTSLKEMWTNLRLASGAKRSMPAPHPHPHSEANRLALSFATRCSSTQLPASVSRKLQQLKPIRQQVIQIAIDSPAQSDTPFTLTELEKATKTSKDTTPGIDKIPYSMLHHLGPSSMGTLLRLFNASYHQGTLPQAWKSANLIPIPKRDSTNAFRPISLLSCIGKTMERAVLHRLQHIIPSLHPHILAYEKGTGTADNIATLLSLTDGNDSVIVFLDLEKAFELANHDAILHALAEKGVKGKLLKWVKDYLSNRKARVRFQGHTSDFYPFENGTPQGGLLGPFLFNLLIVKLVEIPFPNNTHLLAYADDLQLVVTGRNRYVNAQLALNLLESTCKELGLKINSNKTKALQIRRHINLQNLYIGNLPLDWVNSHKCLGIFFNENLSSTTQLRHLLLRTKPLLNVMRRLTSSKLGAGF